RKHRGVAITPALDRRKHMQNRSYPHATRRTIAAVAAFAAIAASAFAAHAPASHAAPAKPALVSTRTTTLGRILVDAHGRTLYLFARDRIGKSSCSGQCETFWPPLITHERLAPPAEQRHRCSARSDEPTDGSR